MDRFKNVTILTKNIKSIEKSFEHILPGDAPFVVRLDGVNFKEFTRNLRKPFDPHFTEALKLTTEALVERTAATIGFCQSDEITLISGPATSGDSKNHLYGGRTQKIASILASFASVRFNHYLTKLKPENYPSNPDSLGFFDARVFSVPNWETAGEVLIWRHHFDCRRNALHSIAQANYPAKSIEGHPIKEVIQKLLMERNIDAYKDYPSENVYGCFVKKVKVEIEGRNPKTCQIIQTIRNRIVSKSFDWTEGNSDEIVKFVSDPFFK
jgi:tRNA(His) guanylyltransferase